MAKAAVKLKELFSGLKEQRRARSGLRKKKGREIPLARTAGVTLNPRVVNTKPRYLTNDTAFALGTEREIADNGLAGDARVRLYVAPALGVEGATWAYLDTNGGYRLIQEAEGRDSVSVSQAADALGYTPAELLGLLLEEIPGLDWSVPESAGVSKGKKIPGVGVLSSNGALTLGRAKSKACGHWNGPDGGQDPSERREMQDVLVVASRLAAEYGKTIEIYASKPGAQNWQVAEVEPR